MTDDYVYLGKEPWGWNPKYIKHPMFKTISVPDGYREGEYIDIPWTPALGYLEEESFRRLAILREIINCMLVPDDVPEEQWDALIRLANQEHREHLEKYGDYDRLPKIKYELVDYTPSNHPMLKEDE